MNTTPLPHVNGMVLEHQSEQTLEEISRACAVQTAFILELLEEGVVTPLAGSSPERWCFSAVQLRHVTVAWRLQRDLGVNLAGAALALQLLDEVETLRAQIAASVSVEDD